MQKKLSTKKRDRRRVSSGLQVGANIELRIGSVLLLNVSTAHRSQPNDGEPPFPRRVAAEQTSVHYRLNLCPKDSDIFRCSRDEQISKSSQFGTENSCQISFVFRTCAPSRDDFGRCSQLIVRPPPRECKSCSANAYFLTISSGFHVTEKLV
jgi:hypothetical protein